MSLPQSIRRREGGDWIDRELASLRQVVESRTHVSDVPERSADAISVRERVQRATRACRPVVSSLPRSVRPVVRRASWKFRDRPVVRRASWKFRELRFGIVSYAFVIAIAVVVGWLLGHI
jgi:hypothetical protein